MQQPPLDKQRSNAIVGKIHLNFQESTTPLDKSLSDRGMALEQQRALFWREELRMLTEEVTSWMFDRVLLRPHDGSDWTQFNSKLYTGVELCDLLRAIDPSLKAHLKYKANAKSGSFQARENILTFLDVAGKLGVQKTLLFDTNTLIPPDGINKNNKHSEADLQNQRRVVVCLLALARIAYNRFQVQPPDIIKFEEEINKSIQQAHANERASQEFDPNEIASLDENSIIVEYTPVEGDPIDERLSLELHLANVANKVRIFRKKEGFYRYQGQDTFLRIVQGSLVVREKKSGNWVMFLDHITKTDPSLSIDFASIQKALSLGHQQSASKVEAVDEVKNATQKLEERIARLISENEKKDKEILTLKDQHDTFDKASTEKDEIIDQLKSEITLLKDKRQEDDSKENSEKDNEIKTLTQQIEKLKEIQNTVEQLNKVSQEKSESENKILSEQYEIERQKNSQLIFEKDEEIMQLKSSLENPKSNTNELQESLVALTESHAKCGTEKLDLENKLTELQEKFNQLETQHHECAQNRSFSDEKIQDLESKLIESEKDKDQIASLNNSIKELNAEKAVIQNSSDEKLLELQQTIIDLTASTASVTSDKNSAESKLSELEEQLTDSNSKLSNCLESKAAYEARIHELEQQFTDKDAKTKSQITQLEKMFSKLEKGNEDLRKKNTAQENKISELQALLDKSSQLTNDQEQELNDEIIKLKQERDTLKLQYNNLNDEMKRDSNAATVRELEDELFYARNALNSRKIENPLADDFVEEAKFLPPRDDSDNEEEFISSMLPVVEEELKNISKETDSKPEQETSETKEKLQALVEEFALTDQELHSANNEMLTTLIECFEELSKDETNPNADKDAKQAEYYKSLSLLREKKRKEDLILETPESDSTMLKSNLMLRSLQKYYTLSKNKHQRENDAFKQSISRAKNRLMLINGSIEKFHALLRKTKKIWKKMVPFFGITIIDASLLDNGVRVTDVAKGSAVEKSGVQPGDIVWQVNGRPTKYRHQFMAIRNSLQPGDIVRLQVSRKGVILPAECKLGTKYLSFQECLRLRRIYDGIESGKEAEEFTAHCEKMVSHLPDRKEQEVASIHSHKGRTTPPPKETTTPSVTRAKTTSYSRMPSIKSPELIKPVKEFKTPEKARTSEKSKLGSTKPHVKVKTPAEEKKEKKVDTKKLTTPKATPKMKRAATTGLSLKKINLDD